LALKEKRERLGPFPLIQRSKKIRQEVFLTIKVYKFMKKNHLFTWFTQPCSKVHLILRIMKISILLMLLGMMNVMANNSYSQSKKITLNLKGATVEQVLNEIEKKSEFYFLLNQKLIDINRKVDIDVEKTSIKEILSKIFNGENVDYLVYDRQIVLTTKVKAKDFKSEPPQTTISGNITAASDGSALPGVNILVKGTNKGAISDVDGNFNIEAESTATLIFSMMGYLNKEVAINGQSVIKVVMEEDTKSLEEVVVVGYGTLKKGNITNAVATFSADNLDERPLLRLDQAMVGQMSGVQIKQTTGSLGKAFSVLVRGTGSLSAGNEPLYVIDGFPLATAAPNGSGNFASGNPLDNINPNDIESIQVLKDASAAAIYGSRAANGVVIITTKKGKSGKPIISFQGHTGFNQAIRKIDMLSSEEWIDRSIEMINAAWVASSPGRTADQTTDQRRTILGLAANAYNTGLMIDDRWNLPGHPGLGCRIFFRYQG